MQRLILAFFASVLLLLAGCAPTLSGASIPFAKGQVWTLALSKGAEATDGMHMHFLTLEEQRSQDSLIGFTGTSESMDGSKTKYEAGIAITRDGRQAFATVFLEPGSNFNTRKAIYCLIFPDKTLWMGRGLVGVSSDFERAVSSSAEFRKQQACVLSRVQ